MLLKQASFKDDYQRGMESLFNVAPTFANFALSLGVPVANEESPHRAFVSFDSLTGKIEFNLKPSYIASLKDEEIGAVIAHETYHVLLGHFSEILDDSFKNKQILTIAHECIINDGLESNIGLTLPGDHISGEPYERNFSYDSSSEAYDFLEDFFKTYDEKPEDDKGGEEENKGGEDGEAREDSNTTGDSGSVGEADSKEGEEGSEEEKEVGSNAKEAVETGERETKAENSSADSSSNGESGEESSCGGLVFDPADLDALSEAIRDALSQTMTLDDTDVDELQEIVDNASEELDLPATLPGLTGTGTAVKLVQSNDYSLQWEALLARINPKVMGHGHSKESYNWHRPPRRLGAFYPEVILPSRQKGIVQDSQGDELPVFLIFVDVSYSIPEWTAQKAVEMALNVPFDLIKPRVYSFNTRVQEIDILEENPAIWFGGGTDFYEIVETIQKVKEDHKEVYSLVISDLEAYHTGNMSSFDFEKLFWMTIPNTNVSWTNYWKRYSPAENFYKIEDFSNLKK